MNKEITTQQSYHELLVSIKRQVQSAQAKAALSVNNALILLYWDMGKMIADNQALFEGRNNYVEQLAKDLRAEFPEMKGFSRSNLFYIRKFYQFYATFSIQQAVGLNETSSHTAQGNPAFAIDPVNSIQQPVGFNLPLLAVPWGHHVVLLDKAKSVEEALFYIHKILENNWSRAILSLQIEQDLFQRQGKAITNFERTLPEKQAQMAGQILKDPYNFGFLTLEPKVQELDVERQLT